MRGRIWIAVGSVAWAVLACGGDEAGEDLGLPDPSAGRRSEKLASAEEVAEKARGRIGCPAKVRTPPRAAGVVVDDVVGVRPGLTYEEAVNLVLCSHELLVLQEGLGRFNIQTFGAPLRQGFSARFAQAEKSADQIRREFQGDFFDTAGVIAEDMQPGQAKWAVTTMGMPGEERVIAVLREEWFATGRFPTLASVEKALLEKYGAPTRNAQPGERSGRIMTWAYDPSGALAVAGTPVAGECMGSSDPDGGTSYSPDCGLVVAALIAPSPENPALARSMEVGVVDQAGGYAALQATEQGLRALDAKRRADEVSRASRSADAPAL